MLPVDTKIGKKEFKADTEKQNCKIYKNTRQIGKGLIFGEKL